MDNILLWRGLVVFALPLGLYLLYSSILRDQVLTYAIALTGNRNTTVIQAHKSATIIEATTSTPATALGRPHTEPSTALHEQQMPTRVTVDDWTFLLRENLRPPNCHVIGCYRTDVPGLASLCSSNVSCSGFSFDKGNGCLRHCNQQQQYYSEYARGYKYYEKYRQRDIFDANGTIYISNDKSPDCINIGCGHDFFHLAAWCSSETHCSGFSYTAEHSGCLKQCSCQASGTDTDVYHYGVTYFAKHPYVLFRRPAADMDWPQRVPDFVLDSPESLNHHAIQGCLPLGKGPPRERPRIGSCGRPCVAHCIVGYPREGISREVFHSLRFFLVDVFSPDSHVFLYLKVSGLRPDVGKHVLATRHSYGTILEKIWPMAAYLNVTNSRLVYENCTSGACVGEQLALLCNQSGVPRDLSVCRAQWQGFSGCMDMVREHEAAQRIRFDWVTKVRPDVGWMWPVVHASFLNTSNVWVSPINMCGLGGIDWFVAIPREFADAVSRYSEKASCARACQLRDRAHSMCLGCECLLIGHLFAEGISFQTLPWAGLMPLVFCGPDCAMERVPPNISSLPCKLLGDNRYWCMEADKIPDRIFTGRETFG